MSITEVPSGCSIVTSTPASIRAVGRSAITSARISGALQPGETEITATARGTILRIVRLRKFIAECITMINSDRKKREVHTSFKIRRFVHGYGEIAKQTAHENILLSIRSLLSGRNRGLAAGVDRDT